MELGLTKFLHLRNFDTGQDFENFLGCLKPVDSLVGFENLPDFQNSEDSLAPSVFPADSKNYSNSETSVIPKASISKTLKTWIAIPSPTTYTKVFLLQTLRSKNIL